MDVTGAIPTTMIPNYGWNHNDNSNNVDHDTILRSLSDIRMEGKETEGVLLRTAAANAAVSAKETSDSTFRLHENIRNVADQILVSSNMTQAQVAAGNAVIQAQIAASNASVLAAISATELRQLQDELNETRLERNRYHGEVNFGNQLSLIQSQINQLDQVQRSTNQAINFGTGTIGAQTTTSNQVR